MLLTMSRWLKLSSRTLMPPLSKIAGGGEDPRELDKGEDQEKAPGEAARDKRLTTECDCLHPARLYI
jgi:hypothetical protein